jgi:glycosyltransferase involved in cell wall biosynthesis
MTEKSIRGGELQTLLLIQRADKGKHFIACRDQLAEQELLKKMSNPKFIFNFSWEFNLFTCLKLLWITRKYKIDIVHSHTSKALGIGVITKLMGGGFKHITTKRTIFPLKNFWSKFKYSGIGLDRVIGISDHVLKCLRQEMGGLYFKQTDIVFSAIDESKLNSVEDYVCLKRGLDPSKIIIGNTSAFSSEKNYSDFFEIAKQVLRKRNDIQFVAIGEGQEKEYWKEQMSKERDLGQVLILDFDRNIDQYYYLFDYFLNPTLSEGLGTSFIHARKYRNFIFSPGVPSVDEVLADYTNKNPLYPLGKTIDWLISNAKKKPLHEAEDLYLRKFYPEYYAQRYIEIYDGLAQNKVS